MTKHIAALALPLAAVVLALGGCHGGSKGGVFATRHGNSPDEFAVGRAAPLTVPPDFALVPPRPGQPRPQEADSSTQALSALFGGAQRVSPGEAALTNAAGNPPPAGVRTDAGGTGPTVVDKGGATRDILNSAPTANPQANASTGTAAGAATQADAAAPPATNATPVDPSTGANPPKSVNTNPQGTAPQGGVPH